MWLNGLILLTILAIANCIEAELAVEAAFQGRCGHNSPCEQLCYEIHDGMYECDCYEGYELNKNGYSCQELNNTYFLDGRSEEDILYQKGVSFSAKLESNLNTNNYNNNYVDTSNSENLNGVEETDISLENVNDVDLNNEEQQQQQQRQQEQDNASNPDDNISFSSGDNTSKHSTNADKVPASQQSQKINHNAKQLTTLSAAQNSNASIKASNATEQQQSGSKKSTRKKFDSASSSSSSVQLKKMQSFAKATNSKTSKSQQATTQSAKLTTTTTNAPSIPSISIIDLTNLQYSDGNNDYYSKQDMSIYDDVNNNKLNLRQFNSDAYRAELLQKQNILMQQQQQANKQTSPTSTLKSNSESKTISNNNNNHNKINNNGNTPNDYDDNDDSNDNIDNDSSSSSSSSFDDKDTEFVRFMHKTYNDNNDADDADDDNVGAKIITKGIRSYTSTIDASQIADDNGNNKMSNSLNTTTTSKSGSPTPEQNLNDNGTTAERTQNWQTIASSSSSLIAYKTNAAAADINLQKQKNSSSSSSSTVTILKDTNATESLRVLASSWQSCNLDCGCEGLCEFIESETATKGNKPMRCLCPFGKTGNGCKQDFVTPVPRFTHNSWLAFPALSGAYKHVQLRVEFRPEAFDGIILLTGERDDLTGDFMALLIHQGFIEFWFDCGSGVGSVRSKETVELNQWNTITIYRHRWDAWLVLNHGQRVQGRSKGLFSRITFREPVFLGGTGNITGLAKRLPVQNGMLGCIRRFIANEHEYKFNEYPLGDVTKGFDIQDCSTDKCVRYPCQHGGKCLPSDQGAVCLCPLGFGGDLCEMRLDLQVPSFNGSSYLRFAPLGDSALIWLELQIIIKPHRSDGVILYSGHEENGDYISLSLSMGYVEFAFDLGSGPALVRNEYPLTLGQWHTIRVSRTARLAVLRIDHDSEVMTISSNGFWHLSLPHSLFLGGIHNLQHLPLGLKDRGSFVGCIQKVEINGRTLSIISEALAGSNVDNCPHACIAKPCGPLAECLPLLDSYECRCSPFNNQCNQAEEVALKDAQNAKQSPHIAIFEVATKPKESSQESQYDDKQKPPDYNYDDDDDDDNNQSQEILRSKNKSTTTITTNNDSISPSSTTTIANSESDVHTVVIATERTTTTRTPPAITPESTNKTQSPEISDIYYYYYDKDEDNATENDDTNDASDDIKPKPKSKASKTTSATTTATTTRTKTIISSEPKIEIDSDNFQFTTAIINDNNNNIKSSLIKKSTIKTRKQNKHHHHQHHHHHNYQHPHHQHQQHNSEHENTGRSHHRNNHHHHHQQHIIEETGKNNQEKNAKVNLYKKMLFNTEINTNNSESQLKGYKRDNNLSYKIDQYITLEKDDQMDQYDENVSVNDTTSSRRDNRNDQYDDNNDYDDDGINNADDNEMMKENESIASSEDSDEDLQLFAAIKRRRRKEYNQMGDYVSELSREATSKESIGHNYDENNTNGNKHGRRKHKKFENPMKINRRKNKEELQKPINLKDAKYYNENSDAETNTYTNSNSDINDDDSDKIDKLGMKSGDTNDYQDDSDASNWQDESNNSDSEEQSSSTSSNSNKNINRIYNTNNNNDGAADDEEYDDDDYSNDNGYLKPINEKVSNNKWKKVQTHKKVKIIHMHKKQIAAKANGKHYPDYDVPTEPYVSSTTATTENNFNVRDKCRTNINNNNNDNNAAGAVEAQHNTKASSNECNNGKQFDPETSTTIRIPKPLNINVNNNIRDKSTSSAFLVDGKDYQTKELIKDMERIMKNADEYNYNPMQHVRPSSQQFGSLEARQREEQRQLKADKQLELEHYQQFDDDRIKKYFGNTNKNNITPTMAAAAPIDPYIYDGSYVKGNVVSSIDGSNIKSTVGHRKNQQHGACFTGTDSYFHYNDAETMSQIISYNVDLNLRFKTHSTNGVILWTGRQSARDKDDYLSLGIENGYLHLRYNLGSGETNIQFNSSKVSDGLWHRVRAMRNSQEGFLEVDGRKSIPQRSPGKLRQLNTDTGLYVGGMPDVSFYTRRRYYTGIVGCISEIVLAGELKLNLDPSTLGTARNVETGIL